MASQEVSPLEWGKKPSPRCDDVRDETVRPEDKMVEYYIILKDNY